MHVIPVQRVEMTRSVVRDRVVMSVRVVAAPRCPVRRRGVIHAVEMH